MTERRSIPGGRPSFFDQEFEDEITSVSMPSIVDGRRLQLEASVRDRATMTIVIGATAGAIHTLLADESVIGRARKCTIRIDDPNISRQHARVLREGSGTYVLEDLTSRNRTFV